MPMIVCRPLTRNEEYGVQNGPKAFKLQMRGAMDSSLKHIWHILCPSKLSFTRPKDRWLA